MPVRQGEHRLDQPMKTYVDAQTKERALAALHEMGMSMPMYLRLALIYVAAEKKIPFFIEQREYMKEEVAAATTE